MRWAAGWAGGPTLLMWLIVSILSPAICWGLAKAALAGGQDLSRRSYQGRRFCPGGCCRQWAQPGLELAWARQWDPAASRVHRGSFNWSGFPCCCFHRAWPTKSESARKWRKRERDGSHKRDTTLIWTVHTKQAKSETRKGTRKSTGSRKPT